MMSIDEIFMACQFSGILKVKNGNKEGYLVFKAGKLISAFVKIGNHCIKAEPALKHITFILKETASEINLNQLNEEKIKNFEVERLSEEKLSDLEIEEIADWRKDFISKINGHMA